MEPLIKKCPRCGKPSANPNNPSGRCKSCLAKLRRAKKTPGHWQRAQTKADDALRRQNGENGSKKKTSDTGTRRDIVDKIQQAEKRTGQKLSPDRIDNSKGYAPSNVRVVPEHLNRGRHKVDEDKLREWRKRLKKTDLSIEDLYTLIKAKAYETQDEGLINLVKSLTPETLEEFLALYS